MPPAPGARRGYHHGDLAAALLQAGLELAQLGGPDAVVLREVSRRAGVSHNAAYRHFPSRESLLEAVAKECMARLAALMQQLLSEVPPHGEPRVLAGRRLRVSGEAYVRFALEEPGLFRTAFALSAGPEGPPAGPAVTPGREPAAGEGSPFELLNRQLDELAATGAIPPQRRPGAELVAWSAVHGLSVLLLDGPLRDLDPAGRRAAVQRVLDGIMQSLSARGTA